MRMTLRDTLALWLVLSVCVWVGISIGVTLREPNRISGHDTESRNDGQPPSAIGEGRPGTNNAAPNNPPGNQGANGVVTLAPLSVSLNHDAFDTASLAISGVLCVIGITGVCIALGTLRAIKVQTRATAKSADAARRSADAAVRSLRVHRASVDVAQAKMGMVGGLIAKHSQVQVILKNSGPTKALRFRYCWALSVDGSGAAFPGPYHIVTGDGGTVESVWSPALGSLFTQQQIDGFNNGTQTLYCRIIWEYVDIFGEHEDFDVILRWSAPHKAFVVAEHPKRNQGQAPKQEKQGNDGES